MTAYTGLTKHELKILLGKAQEKYDEIKAKGLKMDISRGKPGPDLLDLSDGLTGALDGYISEDGTDCRNYGGLDGIPEMKKLFADLMGVNTDEVLVGGNSSLSLMYERASLYSLSGAGEKRKFLCPSPGYDRHFSISEYLGMEMITIPMKEDGPDIEAIKRQISDPKVAGIWCVPVFSNPQGIVYSANCVKALAALQPAAPDFRIFWDNAYIVHAFEGEPPVPANLLRECEKAGNYDMPIMFASFSKISFPGAAVSAMSASPANLDLMRKHLSIKTIGPDKLNQLRHVKYYKDADGVRGHMKKVGAQLAPKFNAVLEELTANLEGKGIGSWLKPHGGYFVAFDTLEGCAKRTINLCAEAGLILTPAGATFPYGKDPADSNIRIAPSFPSVSQLKQAMTLFCCAVELAALEKLLEG